MAGNKSSISKKNSYKEIGEYWDSHDLSEIADRIHTVDFEVDLGSDVHYLALDDSLSDKVSFIAKRRGISPETLVNLWLQEKVLGEMSEKR